jgi:hypothetical protein
VVAPHGVSSTAFSAPGVVAPHGVSSTAFSAPGVVAPHGVSSTAFSAPSTVMPPSSGAAQPGDGSHSWVIMLNPHTGEPEYHLVPNSWVPYAWNDQQFTMVSTAEGEFLVPRPPAISTAAPMTSSEQ